VTPVARTLPRSGIGRERRARERAGEAEQHGHDDSSHGVRLTIPIPSDRHRREHSLDLPDVAVHDLEGFRDIERERLAESGATSTIS